VRTVRLELSTAAAAMTLVVALLAGCGSSSSSSSTPVNSVVNVRLIPPNGGYGTYGEIRFTPATVKPGTVTFTVVNYDLDDHVFSINGHDTAFIPPGGKAVIKVTFAKKGSYGATCPDSVGIGGVFKVT
jgi:plastocyanin